ncbi:MAG: hypothetical protein LUC32_07755 [Clostridiales bacterium]|nr:hypothetical protein [Clostridiales bacterium]
MEAKKKERTGIQRAGMFFDRYAAWIAVAALMSFMVAGTVFATTSADTLWATVTDLIKTRVTRLGAVVMFVGGVMFGLGWKSDDAEQKSRGISTIIAGAIVMAVAGLTSTFFA